MAENIGQCDDCGVVDHHLVRGLCEGCSIKYIEPVLHEIAHAAKPSRRGPDLKSDSFVALQRSIAETVHEIGPVHLDSLRDRMGVASELKFAAAVTGLVQAGICERGHGALRRVGDTRDWPMPGSLSGQGMRKAARRHQRDAGGDESVEESSAIVEEALGSEQS
jgi:hypothetical protein